MDYYFFDNDMNEEIIDTSKFLVFKVAEEKFAIDIYNVVEIVNMQPLRDVPDLPEYIVGIINLRNQVYPIMDLNIRFRNPVKEYGDKTCIILVNFKDLYAGIMVDDILEVAEVEDTKIALPQKKKQAFNRFIKQIINRSENDLVFVIDCDALFVNEEEYIKELNVN